jgi:hypothetical protein
MKLANLHDIYQATIGDWENNKHTPSKKLLLKLFLMTKIK